MIRDVPVAAYRARKPTLMQIRFVRSYLRQGDPRRAAKDAGYKGGYSQLKRIGSQTIKLPHIQELIRDYSRDLRDLADDAVRRALLDESKPSLQLRAADIVYKLRGEYAPEKHEHSVSPHPLLTPDEEQRLREIKARERPGQEAETRENPARIAQGERSHAERTDGTPEPDRVS